MEEKHLDDINPFTQDEDDGVIDDDDLDGTYDDDAL